MKKQILFILMIIILVLSGCSVKKDVAVGSVIQFGKYNIDTDLSDSEPIEWIVIAKEDGKLLLLSRYALEEKYFNTEEWSDTTIAWENSKLRAWLNSNFYEDAFSDAEKNRIILSHINNSDNSEFGTDGGNDTDDNVFLLSADEVTKYLTEKRFRICEPTPYAQKTYRYIDGNLDDEYRSCMWWLRSIGGETNRFRVVDTYSSSIGQNGTDLSVPYYVRPAMWVKNDNYKNYEFTTSEWKSVYYIPEEPSRSLPVTLTSSQTEQ